MKSLENDVCVRVTGRINDWFGSDVSSLAKAGQLEDDLNQEIQDIEQRWKPCMYCFS